MGLWGQPETDDDEGSRRRALRTHGARLLVALALAGATFLLFPSAPAVESPLYEVGSVAPENVIAPFAFRVPKPPAELQAEREAAVRATPPVYAYVPGELDSARAQLARFAAVVDGALDAPPAQAAVTIQSAASAAGMRLTLDELAYLRNEARRRALFGAVERMFARYLPLGVTSNNALGEVRGQIAVARADRMELVNADSVPTFTTLLARSRLEHPDPGSDVAGSLYVKLLSAFFRPTLVADRPTTERRRGEAAQSVEADRFYVRAGEKIVGAHEVVGREEYEKLRGFRDALQRRGQAESSPARGAARVAGTVLYNLVLIVVLGVTPLLFRPQLYRSFRVILLFAAAFLLVIGTAAAVARMPTPRPELVPVALAAVLFSILFDPRISLVSAMVLAVLVGNQGPFRGTNALFILLVGGVAAAVSVRTVRRRNQAFYSMLVVAGGYALAALVLGLTLGWGWREFGLSAGAGLLGAVVSVSLAMGLLAPAEEFTGIDTYLRLLEWSDLNRPLMQRLSLEAPGTYAHTVAVANLAEAACRAIGANPLLARVGCYYHDIGKLARPQYFVENQRKGLNPHDKLRPDASASIIRNHVREGLELAHQHGLPRTLRAFITEHHGTGSIAYFLERAKERGPDVADPAEFAYPGPLPQSAETAVVMLADGVEAAVRVLSEATPVRVRDVIDHIVRQRTEQGQLREAPLTLRQIDVVKEEFARVLAGMYHARVDYPTSSGGITSEFAAV